MPIRTALPVMLDSLPSGGKTPHRRVSMHETALAPDLYLVSRALQQRRLLSERRSSGELALRRRSASDPSVSLAEQHTSLFNRQLGQLIDRDTAYIETIGVLCDAFWMPLARRYLSSNGRRGSVARDRRRRFSLVGLLHQPHQRSSDDIVQILNGLFSYLPAIRTVHSCLVEELKVW